MAVSALIVALRMVFANALSSELCSFPRICRYRTYLDAVYTVKNPKPDFFLTSESNNVYEKSLNK